jgi:hypothetical protein
MAAPWQGLAVRLDRAPQGLKARPHALNRFAQRHHRGVSSLARHWVPNLSVKNVRVAVIRASD